MPQKKFPQNNTSKKILPQISNKIPKKFHKIPPKIQKNPKILKTSISLHPTFRACFELIQNILDKFQKTKTIPENEIFGVIEVKVQLVQNYFGLP